MTQRKLKMLAPSSAGLSLPYAALCACTSVPLQPPSTLSCPCTSTPCFGEGSPVLPCLPVIQHKLLPLSKKNGVLLTNLTALSWLGECCVISGLEQFGTWNCIFQCEVASLLFWQCSWEDWPQLCALVPSARPTTRPGLPPLLQRAHLCSLTEGYCSEINEFFTVVVRETARSRV